MTPEEMSRFFVYDEGTDRTASERYRQGAARLYGLADLLARDAAQAMHDSPEDEAGAVCLYNAAAQILSEACRHTFVYVTIRDCQGEG